MWFETWQKRPEEAQETVILGAQEEKIEFNDKQFDAYDALCDETVTYLMFGGAKGGGKSVFGCLWMWIEARELIRKYFRKKRKYPVPIGWMGRKQSVDFNDTTLERWKEHIPEDWYVIKSQAKEIIIADRVKIDYGGFDRSEDIRKFNSAAYARIFVDQAEEINEDEAGMLTATMNRPVGRRFMPGKALFTANPAQCWLKPRFITHPAKNHRFIQALPGDNVFLPDVYIEQLKESFGHRPEILEAYLYGSWDVFEGADQIIRSVWLREAANRTIYQPSMKRLLACDPARFGDDETVIYYLENTEIMDTSIVHINRTTDISNRLAAMSTQHHDCDIVVESIGSDLGAGVIDELVAMGKNPMTFNPATKANHPEKFVNQRAEAWHTVGKMFANGEISLKNTEPRLEQQLCTPRYKFKLARLAVEPKSEIKLPKRLGCSPDRADTLIIGLYHLQYVQEEPKKPDRWADQPAPLSAMAM